MSQAFADGSGKVYIAESRVDMRGLVRDALKDLGFSNIKVCSSIVEIVDLLQLEDTPPEWIVASLMPTENINAMQLLALCVSVPSLHNCKVSLLLEPDEKYCIRKAFELGLLSYHFKPFTKVSLTSDLGVLKSRFATDKTDGCLTAASYLRAYLVEENDFQEAIKFDEFLITLFPENGDLFLTLAENQHMAGSREEALKTLAQARYLDPETAKAAKQLYDLVQAGGPPPEEGAVAAPEASFASAFSIKSAILIDSDEAVRKTLCDTMTELGISNVQQFGDGESAWKWIDANSEEVSLIITEWRLSKLSAPLLVQRIRDKKIVAPVIVFSSLVKSGDSGLLREIGVAQIIQKPLNKKVLLSHLMATIRQERFPTEYRSIERQIKGALLKGKVAEATKLYKVLAAMPEVPESAKKLMEAEICLADENFEGAKNILFEVMKLNREALQTLNLLGKVYMKMRSFDDAIKCLDKAQEMSSQNLERLCLLAEARAETGDAAGAEEDLEKAKGVDAGSSKIKETEMKVAISVGDSAKAKTIASSVESFGEVVSFMNNRAISLTKSGNLPDAIKLYETAIASIPKKEEQLRAVVNYNLALAYVRTGDMKKASSYATEAGKIKSSTVSARAASIKSRLDEATAKGQIFKLAAADEKPATMQSALASNKSVKFLALDLGPGQLRCHQVYNPTSEQPELVGKMLQKLPSFTKSIKK